MSRIQRKEGLPIVPQSRDKLAFRDLKGEIRPEPWVGRIPFTKASTIESQVHGFSRAVERLVNLRNYEFDLAMDFLPEFNQNPETTKSLIEVLTGARRALQQPEEETAVKVTSQPTLENVREKRWSLIHEEYRRQEDYDRLKAAMEKNPQAFAFYEEELWDEAIGD